MITRDLLRTCVIGFSLAGGGAATLAASYVPPTYAGTGPYRRVYANTGYAYMSASVTLPSAPAISMTGTDTPYVYTGGWGANGNDAVDAGFQYSPTFNDWSLFLSVSDGQTTSDNAPRFKAGQTVTLQFSAIPSTGTDATLQVSAQGMDIANASVQRTLSLTSVPNWGVAANDTLKRMTSIAQDVQNLSDGSFIKGVDWSNSTIGTSSATASSWLAAETGGYQSYTSSVVSVDYVNAGNETDSITLAVPEPGTAAVLAGGLVALGCIRRRRFHPE